MDEPSKDWPFSKMDLMFLDDTARFFMMPFMSVNCSLTNFISCSFICLTTFSTFSFQTESLKFFIFTHLHSFFVSWFSHVMENTFTINVYKFIA